MIVSFSCLAAAVEQHYTDSLREYTKMVTQELLREGKELVADTHGTVEIVALLRVRSRSLLDLRGGILTEGFEILKALFNPPKSFLNYFKVVLALLTHRICRLQKVDCHTDDAKGIVDLVGNFANAGPEILQVLRRITGMLLRLAGFHSSLSPDVR